MAVTLPLTLALTLALPLALTLTLTLTQVISPCGGRFGRIVRLIDHDNGRYTIEYVAELSARYALSITIDAKHIVGSPFSVDVPLHSAASDAASADRE